MIVGLPILSVAILLLALIINSLLTDDPFERLDLSSSVKNYSFDLDNSEFVDATIRLKKAIQFPTISFSVGGIQNEEALQEFNGFIENSFPELHSAGKYTKMDALYLGNIFLFFLQSS